MGQVPLAYRIIAERLNKDSIEGEITVFKARRILTAIFRIPRVSVTRVIVEMKNCGMVSRINQRTLLINGH